VVVDDVEEHLDAARVRGLDQRLELRFGAEARVERLVVVRPVTMEGAVLEPSARHAHAGGRLGRRTVVDLLRDGRDPDRRGAEARDLIELRGEAGEVAAVEAARIVAVHVGVVGARAVGEAVEDDEVEHRVGPVALRHHRHGAG